MTGKWTGRARYLNDERLRAQIDMRKIDLEGGIKTLGQHAVRVELHAEVVAELVVNVVPEV